MHQNTKQTKCKYFPTCPTQLTIIGLLELPGYKRKMVTKEDVRYGRSSIIRTYCHNDINRGNCEQFKYLEKQK